MIYFIRNGANVKIGYATSIPARVRSLRTANAADVVVLGAMEGTKLEERDLHERFKDHRLRGEWFILHQDIISFIEKHCRPCLFDVRPTWLKVEEAVIQPLSGWWERFRTLPSDPVPMPAPIPTGIKVQHEPHMEEFFHEAVRQDDGSCVTALAFYDHYCEWCERTSRHPNGLPVFAKALSGFGVQKAKIEGKIRFIGVALIGERQNQIA